MTGSEMQTCTGTCRLTSDVVASTNPKAADTIDQRDVSIFWKYIDTFRKHVDRLDMSLDHEFCIDPCHR